MEEIYESFFRDSGSAQAEYDKAMRDYVPEYEESDEEIEKRIRELWDDLYIENRMDLCIDAGISIFASRHDYDDLPYNHKLYVLLEKY